VGLVEAGELAGVVVDVADRLDEGTDAGGPPQLGGRERVGLEVALGGAEPALGKGG